MARAWMPFYGGDFLGNTLHLSGQDIGAYVLILWHCWEHGGCAPDDDRQLARIARVHPPHWKRIRRLLEPLFDTSSTPGQWVSKRVVLELTKNAEISSKRKAAAKQKHPQSQSQSQEGSSSSSARARENLVSHEALELADAVALMCGHDTAFVPPAWCGAAMHVQKWLNSGWSREVILAAIGRKVAKHGSGDQIKSIKFFEQCIAREVASLATPVPLVKPGEPQTINAGGGNGRSHQDDRLSVSKAADRLAERLERGEVVFPPRPTLLPTEGESNLRLVSPGRSTRS